MNKYVSRGLWTVLVTGGFMALGVGVANADTGTSGQDGIASGTQGILGIELPIQLGGNSISVLGDASTDGATSSAPAEPAAAPAATPAGTTDGTDSVAGGTQLLAGLGAPIQLGGNSISVLGDASSSGSQTAPAASGGAAGAPSGGTGGEDGVLSGTQILGDLGLPVTLGGNAISVLGDASTSGAGTSTPAVTGDSDSATTDGTDSTLGGSQVLADLGVPVTLGGNAISVLGDASSTGSETAPAGSGGSAGAPAGGTDGEDGVLSGSQVLGDVGVPVTLGGNAISVLGDASSDGAGTASDSNAEGDQEGSTSGSDAVLGGTQVLADLAVPVTLGGNAISVLADAETTGSDPAPVAPTVPTDATDPGEPGVVSDASGTQPAGLDTMALAATGAEGGLTALTLAALLLAAGVALVSRVVIARRR
jgi:hypothetical protein